MEKKCNVCEKAKHESDDNVVRTIIVWTYLSGEHEQCDEEDEEGDGAHRLQVFEDSWSWREEEKKKTVSTCLCEEKERERGQKRRWK